MSQPHTEPSHRDHSSETNSGESFPEPWVGQHPTIAQRREYLVKYFLWARKVEKPREHLTRCFRASLKTAAKRFFEKGQERVLKDHFWYAVDKAVWRLFFDDYGSDKSKPKWPWRKPSPEAGAAFSKTYDMWFEALKAAKKPQETLTVAPPGSLKRVAESIQDRPVKRIVLKRSSDPVEQKDQSAEPLRIVVTHDVGQDGWPIVRYHARRG